MSLLDVVRAGVALADSISAPLQDSSIVHRQWVGQDARGKATYALPSGAVLASGVTRSGAVFKKHKSIQTGDGRLLTADFQIVFVSAIPPHGAPGRHEPIDERDLFIINGITRRVVLIDEPMDPETKRGYISQVWAI